MGMLSIVQFIKGPLVYYSTTMYEAMKGVGTNNKVLIRCVLSRSEVDMVNIKRKYARMYCQSLAESIRKNTSEDYRKVLNLLVHKSDVDVITNPNDLLDASFARRKKFFKEQVKQRELEKFSPGVKWDSFRKLSVMDHDNVGLTDERDNRFFGGTLRKSETQVIKKSDFGSGSISPNHEYDEEQKSHQRSEDSPRRSSMRNMIEPRSSIFRSLSLIQTEQEATKQEKSNSRRRSKSNKRSSVRVKSNKS